MIQRAEKFSPNSVEKDKAILDTVAARLMTAGHQVDTAKNISMPPSSTTA